MLMPPPPRPASRLGMMLMPPLPVLPLLLRPKSAVFPVWTMGVKQPFVVITRLWACPRMIVVIVRIVGRVPYRIVTCASAENGQRGADEHRPYHIFQQHTVESA